MSSSFDIKGEIPCKKKERKNKNEINDILMCESEITDSVVHEET